MNDIVAVLLCAGKGTRMMDDSTNKVCFPVNGIPAVKRTIDNMRSAGIERFVCVVGHRAEKVMECLADYDCIAYAYQHTQNGTGNAALCGLSLLQMLGYCGAALICMGDKIISRNVICDLIDKYNSSDSKIAFAVQPKEFNPGGGRIAMNGDKVCGIYEQTDSYVLKLAELKDRSRENCIAALTNDPINEKKKLKVIDYVLTNSDSISHSVVLSGHEFYHNTIESMPYVNTATYLCDVNATVTAIDSIDSNNAQGEIYLTDAINLLVSERGADIIPIESREDMLTFATKEELNEVSTYFATFNKE